MTNFEMVEALREKADVSYEEAKTALEAADWDLLDAMLLLEKEGKVTLGSGSYSTRPEAEKSEEEPRKRCENARGAFTWLGQSLKKLIHIGNTNFLVFSRKGEELFNLPVTVFALLMLFGFWWLIIAMIVGLFCGLRYSFRGPNLGKQTINNAMNKAAEVAENVKEEFRSSANEQEKTEDEAK